MIGILESDGLSETPEEFIFMNFGATTDDALRALRKFREKLDADYSEVEAMELVEERFGVAPYLFTNSSPSSSDQSQERLSS